MEEIDVVEKIVTTEPEIPVYVPYAGYTVPGIASFDSDDFHVDNFGNVKFSDEIDKIRDDAQDAADAAAASASAAATSETNVKLSEDAAKQYAAGALVSETNATAAKNAAISAQEAAEAAEVQALEYRDSAETYKTDAYNSKVAAETAQYAAENSKNLAIQQADKASDFADTANSYMQQASDFASSANTFAQSAFNNALLAEQYMNEAKEYAKKEYQKYDSLDDLPVPGDSAFIYLVPSSSGTGNDNYSEYIWVSEDSKYEYVGQINDVDLSNYAEVDGTYPQMKVGNATNAQSATKAAQDGDGNVISSTYATKAENAAKYMKPSAGIPATDLSSDVQADLEAGATAYQKPSTGIPESDLANAVQEKLDAVPAPSAANDGNLLSVQDGAYELVDPANVTVGNATNDGDGNNIANTYAKKTEIPDVPDIPTPSASDNGDLLGVSNGAYALIDPSSLTAGNATNDGNGDNIADTYQKKEAGVAFAPNAIELGNQSGSANNANIDFHTDGTTKDFNSRFVAWGNTNDLEVQVGSGGSFRVPNGQTFLPNGDNSAKAATTEFLRPAVVFAQGDGQQSYGYRGKTYNVSLNTGTFTTISGGNFIVLRSGNTVVVSGIIRNTSSVSLSAHYKLLSNLPQSVGMAYGPVMVDDFLAIGRVWIDVNSKTLNITITQGERANLNDDYFAFSITYITND